MKVLSFPLKIEENRLGQLEGSAHTGPKTHPWLSTGRRMAWNQVRQKTCKISWKYLDDKTSQHHVACQGL